MKKLLNILFLLIPILCYSQNLLNIDGFNDQYRGRKSIRLVFYNVENLFDTINDPNTSDSEYTPNGNRSWTYWKYKIKLENLAKVIVASGGWEPPSIIGLCEIENYTVLEDLINTTALQKFQYKIIHQESPDTRGIDVAILYREKKVKYIQHEIIPVVFSEKNRPTRDILRGEFLVNKNDTLHYFVNHWPSRYGGKKKSEPKRNNAAQILRLKIDSLQKSKPKCNIIISGDFNDHPEDNSLNNVLRAKVDTSSIKKGDLINLIALNSNNKGTHKYRGQWGLLDMFIVSQSLISPLNNLSTNPKKAIVFKAHFLLEQEKKYLGLKPKRTFNGYTFQSGFSDHLPIILDLDLK